MLLHSIAPSLLAMLAFAGTTARVSEPPKPYTGSGAADDGGDGEPAGATPTGDPIRDAGAAFLATLSPEELARPLGGEGAGDEEEGGEGGEAVDDGGIDNGDQGSAGLGTDEGAEAAEGEEAPAAGGDKPNVVVLKGETDRGEEDIEIEVEPELAERIRRLQNEGLRGSEFKAAQARVQAREARLADYEEQMEVDPIGFHLTKMPKDTQLEVARALILEHLDALAPDVDKYLADRGALAEAKLALRDQRDKASEQLRIKKEVRAHAVKVMSAVERLVPKGTPADVAEDFIADARGILAQAARDGQRVDPTTVKRLLDRRVKLYGFDKAAAPKAPAAPAVPAGPPPARPLNAGARAVASAAASRTPAAGAQARIRRVQAARAAASRVTPPGAGAAPVQHPAVPKEAETDIASMSKHLRAGGLPATWETAGRE